MSVAESVTGSETRSTDSWFGVTNQLSNITGSRLLERGTGPSLHRWPGPCTVVLCHTQLADADICIRADHHCTNFQAPLSGKYLHLLNLPSHAKLEERFTPTLHQKVAY